MIPSMERMVSRALLRRYVGEYMFCPVDHGAGECGRALDITDAILVIHEKPDPEDPQVIHEEPILLSCPDCFGRMLESIGGKLHPSLRVIDGAEILGGDR